MLKVTLSVFQTQTLADFFFPQEAKGLLLFPDLFTAYSRAVLLQPHRKS